MALKWKLESFDRKGRMKRHLAENCCNTFFKQSKVLIEDYRWQLWQGKHNEIFIETKKKQQEQTKANRTKPGPSFQL
jgi:hypothetical protein